jgi:hypothetical protein
VRCSVSRHAIATQTAHGNYQPNTIKEKMKMSAAATFYKDFLEQEGYHPTIDSDGDVMFKSEGRTYYIDIDEKDPSYFRIMYPNFWSIENTAELTRALLAANYASMISKVAKVYVRSDGKDVSAGIELFFERPEQFKPIFNRAMSALRNGVNNYAEKMKQ